ncbi:haloalkane dehalogenase family protein [Aspergillus puulaauensis]|uniref:AB hydrolase-1 domain-containing protein n=1 Tax=Aspergillus puulaauensis TaxID=1220207 RepID=A0A7R7XKB1_9EURO|nr:uncharacterized protein APUU_31241A [Aspergillus puulaauensis]BCS23016.1 hypothetical protein APUU_31241A [Aspergillus puulaauensis]
MPFHINVRIDSILKSAVCNIEAVSTGVMVVAGYLSSFLLSFTINRIFLAAILIPLYLSKVAFSLLPSAIQNSINLVIPSGWSRLVQNTEQYRSRSDTLAHSQLDGSYRFKEDEVFHVERDSSGWAKSAPWADDTYEFNVCGATVFPSLLDSGHDVYAVDWLGHGRSDKILRPQAITFELHIRTLVKFFEVAELENAIIAAHDWGGCIALCTLPRLPSNTCDGLFLLNSFFPPRLSDTSLHYRLLNRIWYCTTGLLHGFLPQSAVLRFLIPHLSKEDIEAYTAPYKGLPRSSKSSIERFSHMIPSLPRFVLFTLRQTYIWKVLEGLAGPSHFDSLNNQARLSAQGDQVRGYWSVGQYDDETEVMHVFGDKDPILTDYKSVFVQTINPERVVDWAAKGVWIVGAGHMPMEGKPGEVSGLIAKFARASDGVAR